MTQVPYSSDLSNDTSVADLKSYGLEPTSTQAQQFFAEEFAAQRARGQKGNPFQGWKLDPSIAGDFWSVYTMAEQFAANTGWKHLITPGQLSDWIKNYGMAQMDQFTMFQWFTKATGVDLNAMPWATTGMSHSQYNAATSNLDQIALDLTGKDSWDAAGLDPALKQQAVIHGWTQTQITDHILQNSALANRYGWLKHQMNYTSFQNYKTQNADSLRQRFGQQFTDQQAILNLDQPLSAFHAAGGAFGQFSPYTKSDTTIATGNQSSVR